MEAQDNKHYKMGKIEPIDYIKANGLARGFCTGNIIKYLTRYPYTLDGIRDLKKARDYLDMLIELEEEAKNGERPQPSVE